MSAAGLQAELLRSLRQALRYIEVAAAYQGSMTAAQVEEAVIANRRISVTLIAANSCHTLASFSFDAARAAIANAEANAVADEPAQVVVVVDGGLVIDLISAVPIAAVLVDYDTECAPREVLRLVKQGANMTDERAVVEVLGVEVDAFRAAEFHALLSAPVAP